MQEETVILRGIVHVVIECGNCGVVHTLSQLVRENNRNEGGFHWCPNGHQRGWFKGEREKEQEQLRRQRDALMQRQAMLEEELILARDLQKSAEQRANKIERERARIENRSHAALCLECNRSFVSLRRHMATKHPKKCEVVKLVASS